MGGLGFYSSLLLGKLGRGMMGHPIARQYKRRATRSAPVSRRNLVWRFSALGKLAARTSPFGQITPFGAHTDAQCYGRIASARYGQRRKTVHLHLPHRLCVMALED